MYFDSFAEFIAMGGHGLYVWMAYAAFLIILCWNVMAPKLRRRQVLETVARHWRRQELNSTKPNLEAEPLPFSDQDS